MIGTIAVIAAIAKKKKGSAIAAIIWKPLSSDSSADRSDNDRWDRKSSIQRLLSLRSLTLFFSEIAVIVAIIWKPGFIVTNRWKDLQQASRETGRFTRRIGPRHSFTLGYLGLEPTTTLHAQAHLAFLYSSLPLMTLMHGYDAPYSL